jgi:hypothetical protein
MSAALLRGFSLGCSRSVANNLLNTLRTQRASLPNPFQARRKPLSLSFTSNRLQALYSQAQSSNLGTGSILQFAKNTPWQATHRTVGRASRHSGYGPGGGRRRTNWLGSIPPNAIFWGVIAINGAVFIAWQFAKSNYVCTHHCA